MLAYLVAKQLYNHFLETSIARQIPANETLYYSNRGSTSSEALGQSGARVEVYGDGTRPSTFHKNQEHCGLYSRLRKMESLPLLIV